MRLPSVGLDLVPEQPQYDHACPFRTSVHEYGQNGHVSPLHHRRQPLVSGLGTNTSGAMARACIGLFTVSDVGCEFHCAFSLAFSLTTRNVGRYSREACPDSSFGQAVIEVTACDCVGLVVAEDTAHVGLSNW
jgi:hypothetical protein